MTLRCATSPTGSASTWRGSTAPGRAGRSRAPTSNGPRQRSTSPPPARALVTARPAARRELGVDLATVRVPARAAPSQRPTCARRPQPGGAAVPPGPTPAVRPPRDRRDASGPGARRRCPAGDRRADGPVEADDPALLPEHHRRPARRRWTGCRSVNAGRPVTARLVPAALLLKATARAARDVPEMNGFFEDGAFQPSASVHLGVAVSLRTGRPRRAGHPRRRHARRSTP